MLQYTFIFSVLLIIIIACTKKSIWNPSKSNKLGVCLCLLLLCCMSAFKASTVGNDTHEYLRLFEMGDDALTAGTRYELGYLYFSQTIWKISQNPQILFVVYSLFFYASLGRFLLKYSSMPWILRGIKRNV